MTNVVFNSVYSNAISTFIMLLEVRFMRFKLFIIFSVFIVLHSCKREEQVLFEELSIGSNQDLVQVNVPKALGDLELSKVINSEIEKIIGYVLHIGDPDNVASKTLDESVFSFKEEYNNFKDNFSDSEIQWEAQIDGEVLYQSPEIISIAITSYINTGGAHGNTIINLLNFDSEDKDILTNRKLFNSTEKVSQITETFFKKEVEFPHEYFYDESFTLPENIGFTEDGLLILYNTYEIAPYSAGIIEFIIPYSEISSYLNYR